MILHLLLNNKKLQGLFQEGLISTFCKLIAIQLKSKMKGKNGDKMF
jgi:hypothetical protein